MSKFKLGDLVVIAPSMVKKLEIGIIIGRNMDSYKIKIGNGVFDWYYIREENLRHATTLEKALHGTLND